MFKFLWWCIRFFGGIFIVYFCYNHLNEPQHISQLLLTGAFGFVGLGMVGSALGLNRKVKRTVYYG